MLITNLLALERRPKCNRAPLKVNALLYGGAKVPKLAMLIPSKKALSKKGAVSLKPTYLFTTLSTARR